ncbi:sigma-70 family RNA polymerase sigma factor [Chengkuizengella sediminis]|uniref:sigma-70 family RNA polymerase sigma factor n=1 Tax=Chengkuizengella sediminis TaxID=1885917 RepID=UPI0013898B25|nr:sigma-70 family RNA polymerase sigma factor [Chengkuizengella sediminis]
MEIEQLVKEAQKKNDDAFYELISIHKVQLYKIAYSYFNNEQDALEAIQEVTYRTYLKINKLKYPKYFNTWIIRILLNYCNDEIKRKKRMNKQQIEIKVHQNENEFINRLEIESLIENLEPKFQEIIKLKYIQDLTIPQISQILEFPEGTVKTWLNKSLKILRKELEREGEYYDGK